jgi:hypothetical protein
MDSEEFELLQLLADRLERLSADSHWARRASGLRGNILKIIEEAGSHGKIKRARVNLLINSAFNILSQAAREIPDLESILKKYQSMNR